jgi:prephenate dehydrogenase
MRFGTLTIVGVGLIGGSIGRAARNCALAKKVIGVGRNVESLKKAAELGIIEHYETSIPAGVQSADLVVFAAPVDLIASQVIEAAAHCPPGCLLTDAGSTKQKIIHDIDQAKFPEAGVQFIGSHPIAGSAQRGPESAREDLFVNKTVIVTPSRHSSEAGVIEIEAFWRALGAKTIRLSALEHDRLLAWSSHLPHITAAILSGILPPEARPFTGTGFKDTTRIAAGDPEVWLPIIKQNREALLDGLSNLESAIGTFRQLLRDSDWEPIRQFLEKGKRGRDALGS